ncbi:MAG: ATP-binding cassette domain-containing protein [Melioribacteraceae bacterium]
MIDLKNVSVQLGGRDILKNVSLHIENGTTSVILGPSGAGKSTILKTIIGLVKVTNGTVIIDGQDIFSLDDNELLKIRRKIGFVFQGNALFDSLNVADNVSYFLSYNTNISQKEISDKVREILAFVNLEGTENLYPDQLSGGMKKRLAIARALAIDPKIILFDEPTTGLDPINSRSILDLIKRLKSVGTTSVIVTHILDDAIAVGDILTVINNGEIVSSGNVKDLLRSENQFIKDFFYEILADIKFIHNNNIV